jgi:hypothetical protein
MTEPIRPPPETVTYFALSAAKSKTYRTNTGIILGVFATMLTLPDVVAIIPPRYLLFSVAVTASINLWLRTLTVRPIAFIPPGDVKAVQVPKIEAPTTVTD